MSHSADRCFRRRFVVAARSAKVRSSARCERRRHHHPPATDRMPEWLFDLFRWIVAKEDYFQQPPPIEALLDANMHPERISVS